VIEFFMAFPAGILIAPAGRGSRLPPREHSAVKVVWPEIIACSRQSILSLLQNPAATRHSATSDITTAHPEAVVTGMRITFAIAAVLIVVALAIAVVGRALATRPSLLGDVS